MRFTALEYITLHFRNEIPPELASIKIIGATPFYAKDRFGDIFYQELITGQFSLWLSYCKPIKDFRLLIEDNGPWSGMHLLLKDHLQHTYSQEEINLRQGQFNFGYLPKPEIIVSMVSGAEYLIFDFKPSLTLLKNMDSFPNIQAFLKNTTMGNENSFLAKAIQSTNGTLESVEQLLRNPSNTENVLTLLKSIEKNYGRKNLTASMKDFQIAQMFEARHIIQRDLGKKNSLPKIAQMVGTNETYLKQQFAKVFGLTPFQYQAAKRDELVKWFLIHTDFDLDLIALQTAARDAASLIHTFQSRNSLSPTEWRRKYKKLP